LILIILIARKSFVGLCKIVSGFEIHSFQLLLMMPI
jgi:hypothetical protein